MDCIRQDSQPDENTKRGKRNGRSFWLDILRICLCAGVVCCHYIKDCPTGTMGVIGFFVLSGYLLGLSFSKLQDKGLDVCAFYRSKAKRMLPTFTASMLLGVVILGVVSLHHPDSIPFMYSWRGGDFRLYQLFWHFNAPAWYMYSEFAFLAMAPLLFWLGRTGKMTICAIFILSTLYALVLYSNIPDTASFLGCGLYFQPQAHFWQFMAGMFAWSVLGALAYPAIIRKGVLILFAAAMIYLLAPAVSSTIANLHSATYSFTYDAALVALFIVLVPSLDKLPSPDSKFWRSAATHLSNLTYPMYLYHFIVVRPIVSCLEYFPALAPAGIPVSLAVSFILSALSLKFLDSRFK